jgi:hypothetical protein
MKRKIRQSLAGMKLEETDLKFPKFIEYDKALDAYTSDLESDYEDHEDEDQLMDLDMRFFDTNAVPEKSEDPAEDQAADQGEKSGATQEAKTEVEESKDQTTEQNSDDVKEEKEEEDQGKEQNPEEVKDDKDNKEDEKNHPDKTPLDLADVLGKVENIVANLTSTDFVDEDGKAPALKSVEDVPCHEEEPATSLNEDEPSTSLSRQDTKVLPGEQARGPSKRCMSVDQLMLRFPQRALTGVIALSHQETKSVLQLSRTMTRKRMLAAQTLPAEPASKRNRLTESKSSCLATSADSSKS